MLNPEIEEAFEILREQQRARNRMAGAAPDCTLDIRHKTERAKRVSIINIREVISHSIVEYAGLRSHLIRFVGDGEVRFAYNLKGELLEFAAHNAHVDRSDPEHYWIGQLRQST